MGWLYPALALLSLQAVLAAVEEPTFKDTNIGYMREKLSLIRKLSRSENAVEDSLQGDMPPPPPWLKPVAPEPVKLIDPNGGEIGKVNSQSQFSDSLYQGDIVLSKDQVDTILEETLEANGELRAKRQAVNDRQAKLWTMPIAYYFTPEYSAWERSLVTKGMELWRNQTCVDFVENKNAKDRIKFFKSDGCFSTLGRVGGEQELSLGTGCQTIGHAVHELAHALGFYHTHSRFDRDSYINMHDENVEKDWEDQFKKETPKTNYNYELGYDYGSILHYPGNAAVKTGAKYTMESKDKNYQHTMGSYIQGFLDVLMMNKHYNCLDKCAKSTTKCTNGGYPNPANCKKCNCPSGFGGDLCDQRPAGCGSTLVARPEFQKLSHRIGHTGTGFLDEFMTCNFWITAPAGAQIEIRLDSVFGGSCAEGCFHSGVEIKTQEDKQMTGYRVCCSGDTGVTYTSKSNMVPIIMFNRYMIMDIDISYRFVGTTKEPYCVDNYGETSCQSLQKIYNFCGKIGLGLLYTTEQKKSYCAKTCGYCK